MKRLELFFWAVTPCLITLLLVILFLVPKHLPGLGQFMPLLPLIPVFYWGMIHSREMPYWFVFCLGFLMDAMTGSQANLSPLLYLIFLFTLHAQKKYVHKEGFVVKWMFFALLLLFIKCVGWVTVSLMHHQAFPVMHALLQWLLTVGVYPIFHKLFDRLSQHITERRWRLIHGS